MDGYVKVFCSCCGEWVVPIYGGECSNCGEDIPDYEEDDYTANDEDSDEDEFNNDEFDNDYYDDESELNEEW